MFKYFIRISFFFITILILIVLYLSFFGVKTNKFNDQIKSQISKKDNRFNIDLDEIFIKLNLKEKSISLNSKNLDFYITKKVKKLKM